MTYGQLVQTKYIVQEKVKVIQEQAQVIKTYEIKEKLVKVPVKVPVKIDTSLIQIQKLQKQLEVAHQESTKLRKEKTYYQYLVKKYSKSAPKAITPKQRVESEEKINDQFISDWESKK